MAKALPAELREVCKSMFLAGVRPQAIEAETGVSRRLVSKWASREHWGQAATQAKQAMVNRGVKSLARQAAADIGAASANVRASLASVLNKQAAALDSQNPKYSDLANTRERQGQAAVAKSIMETARGVFGWGEESRPGMVLQVHLSTELPSKPATGSVIDVISNDDPPKCLPLQSSELNIPHIVRKDCEQGEPAAGPAAESEPAASPGQPAGPTG